jgi:3-oxoacyl-[acyl-carrier protein] reductase
MSDPKRVALVAGASGGIGATTAVRLAEDGYDLALAYRSNRDAVTEVANRIAALGRDATLHQVTIADYEDVSHTITRVKEMHGRIDALVYAAGPYLHQRWVSEFDPSMVPDVLRDDATACWNLVHAALPHLRESKGSFVSVSTPAVRRHAKKDLLSSMPKAAIEALVRAVASEEGRYGVRANAVAVGVLDDGMVPKLLARGDFDERFFEATLHAVALGRFGSSKDIAEAIAFLVSPERAGYISGQVLTVDGGYAL